MEAGTGVGTRQSAVGTEKEGREPPILTSANNRGVLAEHAAGRKFVASRNIRQR